MKMDTYYVKARLFPTLLTAIPILLFFHLVVAPLYGKTLQEIQSVLPMLANFGLYTAVVFLSVQMNRFVAKEVFQRWFFQEDIRMPTTDILLWDNPRLAIDTKVAIRNKIESSFSIFLLDPVTEGQDELRARNLVVHAVSQIKNKLRGNTALFQHNVEYGFVRNLIGGSLLAVLFSLLILGYGLYTTDAVIRNSGIALVIIYSIFLSFSKMLITRYGLYYAKVLYEQFLSL